ncbi:LytR/AlgR family response regulator transcription factor [Rufibacter glacialis]|uniref:Response regulator transcription factor n=1 Tax=Rufibacter glacialis TaxID=1259555 RepID=A0A5M8QMZ5_9BACT|nr:LytTR family DNA-binding domain-containing protein [Rufibacter glacialis]KAA6437449.1 response regulator transcription factor [Rufibacter glacialis]GGK59238.1 DNA-binding response regulator [Rufibacter glacialis]
MIRCICVDDEAYASNLLKAYIEKIPFLRFVGSTTSPVEALGWVSEGRCDLVFLDIQMPELTGLQFLKLAGHKCKVILTTAYPEYALEGYEHNVVDYLLKPIAFDRFLKAVQKAQAVLAPSLVAMPPAIPLIQPLPAAAAQEYMFVKGESKNKFLRINYADILFIEGLKNYVSLYLPQQRVVTYQTLRELEEQLPQPPFYRVHKSYIISIDKVRMVDGNTLYLQDKEIPIGETYREGFFKLIREKEQG